MQQRIGTFCSICYVHCAAVATVADGKLVKWEQDKESGLDYRPCPSFKGLANIEIADHPDRLKYPVKRAGAKGEGKWQRVSWDEALDSIARKFGELKEEYGPQCIGAGVGEPKAFEYVWLQRFCSAFGTPNIATPHHLCGATRYSAASATWGSGHGIFQWGRDKEDPLQLLIVWGTALVDREGSAYDWVHRNVNTGHKLVVIDPRRLRVTKWADLWIRPRPGSDAVLAMGLIKVIIEENLYDKEFVEQWTVGFAQLCKEAGKFSLDDVERITWVPKQQIQQLARWMGEYKLTEIVTANTWSQGARNFQGARLLNIMRTIIDPRNIPGWGVSSTLQFNQMPAGEMYLLKKFPRNRADNIAAEHKYAVRAAYVPYQDMTRAILDGRIKAAIMVQCNPVVSYPDAKKVYEAFKRLDPLVVLEIFPSPTSAIADFVLPVATSNECDTMSCFTGEEPFKAIPRIIEPPGEARSDIMIINDLAKRLGLGEDFFDSDVATLNHILGYSGLTWEEFKTMRMNRKKRQAKPQESAFFTTASGKAEIYSTRARELYGCDPLPTWEHVTNFPHPTEEYPLLVTSYCDEEYKLTGYKHVRSFRKRKPYPTVQLHHELARSIGANDGDWVWIETPIGRIQQKLVIDPELDPRVVMTSFGWWFPEEGEATSFAWNKSNINVLFPDSPEETTTGSVDVRGYPCRVYKA